MEDQTNKLAGTSSEKRDDDAFDLDALLHPAKAFAHPMNVVRDPDLTLNEKRALLASWASDACAIESAPELRAHASGSVVRWDDIMDALRILDSEADKYGKPLPHYKRVLSQKDAGLWGPTRLHSRKRNDQGPSLN
jgi:hypothetical protein